MLSNKRAGIGWPELWLALAALFWGSTFVVVKQAIAHVDPLFFIGARFLLAAVMLAVLFPKRVAGQFRAAWKKGTILGLLLTLGFAMQTLGLQSTSASASGFITGLSIVLVGVFDALLTKKLPGRLQCLGILSGTFGLLLLGFSGGRLAFSSGDWLTLICAFGFALHIAVTGVFAPDSDPVALSTIQFATVAAVTLTLTAVSGRFHPETVLSVWPAVVFTGIFASGLAFLFQTMAQRRVPAVEAAVILAAEPLFAALFARIFLGETGGWRLMAGGAIIVLGMVLSAVKGTSPAPGKA